MKKKPTTETIPCLALAALAGYTAAQTSKEFVERIATVQRAFVEKGKLVYHLRNGIKLKPGQSVYSILQGQGVPEGSVQQAINTAILIEKLVIPGHLDEARFDAVLTFRINRQTNRLLTGKGKTKLMLTPEAVAALLVTGESAAIGAELDCLCEHGMTIAERENQLAEKAAETERLKLAAAEAEKLKAADELRKADEAAAAALAEAEKAKGAALLASRDAVLPESTPAAIAAALGEDPPEEDEAAAPRPHANPAETPAETPAPAETPSETPAADPAADEEEEAEEEEAEEEEAEDDEDEAPEAVVIDGTRNDPPPAPPAPTLTDITGRMNDALTDAMNLGPDDMKSLLAFLRGATNDIATVLDSMAVEMAA